MKNLMAVGMLLGSVCLAEAQTATSLPTTQATAKIKRPAVPAILPGNGLAEHDFFYAGEARQRKMYIVRKGQVVWSYDDPTGKGEISDAVMLSNGNILIAHQFAVKLISPDQKVLWSYAVPKGSEVHTAIPIGLQHVLFVQNGNPAFVRVVDITTGETTKEFNLETKNPKSVHGQFRHARLTAAGTLMVAHMDMGKVIEYDSDGKVLRTIDAPRVWGVTPLKNGNVLIVDRDGVVEIDPADKTIWNLSLSDVPEYHLPNLQLAWRLPNGNTLFNSWANQWNGPVDHSNAPAQALEVTPDKKVVWALHSWDNPNIGPATTIQILDQPESPENVSFGNIR